MTMVKGDTDRDPGHPCGLFSTKVGGAGRAALPRGIADDASAGSGGGL